MREETRIFADKKNQSILEAIRRDVFREAR